MTVISPLEATKRLSYIAELVKHFLIHRFDSLSKVVVRFHLRIADFFLVVVPGTDISYRCVISFCRD
jgi:hypothetical protein